MKYIYALFLVLMFACQTPKATEPQPEPQKSCVALVKEIGDRYASKGWYAIESRREEQFAYAVYWDGSSPVVKIEILILSILAPKVPSPVIGTCMDGLNQYNHHYREVPTQ